jgi:hypothetical protein
MKQKLHKKNSPPFEANLYTHLENPEFGLAELSAIRRIDSFAIYILTPRPLCHHCNLAPSLK